jgi:hypothetical protein
VTETANLETASENALNYGLVRGAEKNNVKISYEVPLAGESDGQLKADLMVFHAANGQLNTVEIVELKKAAGTDSPLMALIASICYAIQFIRCWDTRNSKLRDEIGEFLGVGLKASRPNTIRLILAAPGSYWKRVHPQNEATRPAAFEEGDLEKMKQVVNGIDKAIPKTLAVSLELFIADVQCARDSNGHPACKLALPTSLGQEKPNPPSILNILNP